MPDESEESRSAAMLRVHYGSLPAGFWPAFAALVEDLARAGDLDCRFGFQVPCGNNGGCDPDALSRAVQQRLEGLVWPVAEPSALTSRTIFDLVELFYDCVAFPVWDICSFCEQSHVVAGDSAIAREKYAGAVNALFRRFDQPFGLHDGRIGVASAAAPSVLASATRVIDALGAADLLAQSHGAARAVDPVHAALHGYMQAVCDGVSAGSATGAGPGVTGLLAYLQKHHPALRSIGARQSDVEDVLCALCEALDALHSVRDQPAGTGPGDRLGEGEAMLAINAARAVFGYLDVMLQTPSTGVAGV